MRAKQVPTRIALAAIRLYQVTLSPYLGRQCRFYPTCSHYAMEAIARHGALRGMRLALARLARCHPFHPGGVDLVPAARHGADAGRAGPGAHPRCAHEES